MGVVQLSVVVDFSCEGSRHGLWDLLDSYTSRGETVGAQSHLAIGAC
jgi:hypothetical protein